MRVSRGDDFCAKMLRVVQVAEQMGISTRTVWRLVASRQLTKPAKIGRCSRWHQKDVDDYLNSLR